MLFCPADTVTGLLLLACCVLSVSSDYSAWSHGSPVRWSKSDLQPLEQPPVFDGADGSKPNIVTVQVGQTAYLQCRVKHLGDKVISWIRQRDLHILTSGPHTYTSDSRVEVVHPPNSDQWTLRIVSTRHSDRGRYECQVNTEPKMMRAVMLDVRNDADMKDSPYVAPDNKVSPSNKAELEVRLSGPAEQFVQTGTTVTFACVVKATKGSLTVVWYHGDRPVSQKQAFRPISMDTERSEAGASSRLTLAHVQPNDAGNYSCVAATTAADAKAASVNLVVVEGEHTEAMQRDMGSGCRPAAAATWTTTTTSLMVLLLWHA